MKQRTKDWLLLLALLFALWLAFGVLFTATAELADAGGHRHHCEQTNKHHNNWSNKWDKKKDKCETTTTTVPVSTTTTTFVETTTTSESPTSTSVPESTTTTSVLPPTTTMPSTTIQEATTTTIQEPTTTEVTPTTEKKEDICYEDEPCWDCETMGNLICGDTPILPITGLELVWLGVGATTLIVGGIEVLRRSKK